MHERVLAFFILLPLSVLLPASACDGNAPNERSPALSDAARPINAATATPSTDVPPGLTPAAVTRVVDGDTIGVLVEGQEFRVRYIGIDTPETVDPRRPVQCFGKEASERNRLFVEGKTVELEKDVSETDEFGRLLRYVWVEGRMVNAALVEEGYATASTFPPDVRYGELFASLQAQARAAGRGLWGPACRSPQATPSLSAGACAHSTPGAPAIKGNVSVRTNGSITCPAASSLRRP